MTLTIVGAGLSGLLAGNMLSKRRPAMVEHHESLPNSHSAVLRFKSSVVGDTLGIPFRRVSMIKAALPWRNPIADALAYSAKNTATRLSDRSITQGLVAETRYIAPNDLITRAADGLKITFGHTANFQGEGPYISTIPMPALMTALDYPREHTPEFSWRAGLNVRARVSACDAYVSLLVPDPEIPFSRISITGDELIVEAPGIDAGADATVLARMAAYHLGIPEQDISHVTSARSAYAKINPIPDDQRKNFLHWATVERNTYSVGRFACWRPGLLLDDVVQDIRLIDGWLDSNNHYDIKRNQK